MRRKRENTDTTRPSSPGRLGRALERGLLPLGINLFPRKQPNHIRRGRQSSEAVFDQIFETKFWVKDQSPDNSASGPGSSLAYTANYAKRIETVLNQLNISTMLDAPCGDLHWMANVASKASWNYIGGDISPSVVAYCNREYPALDVRKIDITRDSLPDVDLWHCRDCFFHLTFTEISAALENFSRSRIDYALLTTHHPFLFHRNVDICTGEFRILDLESDPIGLPRPIAYIRDYRRFKDFPRFMGLWNREQICATLNL